MSNEKLPVVRVVAAVIDDEGKYLITQRSDHAVLPRYWEFPGGRVEESESEATALKREVGERLGVEIEVGDLMGTKSHEYRDYAVELNLYRATISGGEARALGVKQFRWVDSSELGDYPFPPADEAHMNALLDG
jgi:8-oxo-dGTP diphosphatase